MSNVHPIRSGDPVDTAQRFAAELNEADRRAGRRWTAKCFGYSRFRRAAIYDGLAVTMLMALMAALGAIALILATPAKAAPVGEGCVSDFWMYNGLRASSRLICDSDRRADGSWSRSRGFFAESYWAPIRCSRYSCWGGYWVPELKVIDHYIVTDATVLADEPGHIASAEPRVVQ